jgi:hypothetical protein
MRLLIGLMERGVLPDAVIRLGIRLLHRRRLKQEDHWRVSGSHYQRTCEHWLRLMDERRGRIMPIMEKEKPL